MQYKLLLTKQTFAYINEEVDTIRDKQLSRLTLFKTHDIDKNNKMLLLYYVSFQTHMNLK